LVGHAGDTVGTGQIHDLGCGALGERRDLRRIQALVQQQARQRQQRDHALRALVWSWSGAIRSAPAAPPRWLRLTRQRRQDSSISDNALPPDSS
jgi:hypothetical protein